MTRRAAIIVVALVVAALVARGRACRSRLAAARQADARPRPPGRARGHAAGGAAEEPRADRGGPRPLGRRSCATASTSSASPSPRSARRATTRSRSSSRASRTRSAPPRIIGKTAQLELFDLEANLVAALDRHARRAIAVRERLGLRPARRPAGARQGGTVGAVVPLRREEEARRRPRRVQSGGAAQARRQAAEGLQALRRPRRTTVVVSCARRRVSAPASRAARLDRSGSGTCSSTTPPNVPEMTGADLQLSRHPAGLRPADRRSRSSRSTSRTRARTSSRTSRATRRSAASSLQHRSAAARATPTLQPALRDRARPRDQVVAADRLQRVPERDLGRQRRPDHRELHRSRRRRISRSCSRRVRCRSSSSRSTRPRSRRRSARTRCRRRRSPAIVGLLAVALFLLLFYRFLGLIAVFGLGVYAALLYAAILLFNVTLTLPGFAGLVLTLGVAADANVVIFERIKEEARAGRSRARRHLAGLHEGLRTRSSTRTSSRRSPRSCSSPSPPRASAGSR